MSTLVVDTSVWVGRGADWFQLHRRAGHQLAIADQAARELVRQAVEEPADFAHVRAACRRVINFTTLGLPPLELHLLTLLGEVEALATPPDPRRLCREVALSESHADLLVRLTCIEKGRSVS